MFKHFIDSFLLVSFIARRIACLLRWFAISVSTAQTVPMNNTATEFTVMIQCKKRSSHSNHSNINSPHSVGRFEFGEVMERSFGIWHTKCYPKKTLPSVEEMKDLCKKLGFDNVIYAQVRIVGTKTELAGKDWQTNNATEIIPIPFKVLNATKVIPFTKFSAVKLNDGFTVHLRPSKPLAKLVTWDENDLEKCHRMELKCKT